MSNPREATLRRAAVAVIVVGVLSLIANVAIAVTSDRVGWGDTGRPTPGASSHGRSNGCHGEPLPRSIRPTQAAQAKLRCRGPRPGGSTNNPAMYAQEWLARVPYAFHVDDGQELRAAVNDAFSDAMDPTTRRLAGRPTEPIKEIPRTVRDDEVAS